jgi:hypothetical protein
MNSAITMGTSGTQRPAKSITASVSQRNFNAVPSCCGLKILWYIGSHYYTWAVVLARNLSLQ